MTMPIYTSSVSPKGQVTIPVEIREEFGIRTRDTVEFMVVDRQIVPVPTLSKLQDVYGSIPPLDPTTPWREVETGARKEAVERIVAEDKETYDRPSK